MSDAPKVAKAVALARGESEREDTRAEWLADAEQYAQWLSPESLDIIRRWQADRYSIYNGPLGVSSALRELAAVIDERERHTKGADDEDA